MDIRVGDCREVMPSLARVDAIVCDPPYEIGFMGKAWDRSGVAFNPLTWALALSAIRPGGYLLAFGGTRTFHRMTCAIEDAGWEIHDCLSWLYGSGFPKHRSKLKPAWEPIIVARRPAKQATELNIDACRIEVVDEDYAKNHSGDRGHGGTRDTGEVTSIRAGGGSASDGGRWPANVVIDKQTALAIDEQTGILTSNSGKPFRRQPDSNRNAYGAFNGTDYEGFYGDSGGASRFYYCAKASRAERDMGLGAGFERKPLNWSRSGDANPGSFQSEGTDKTARNYHPTVKPLALMRWLCRLVTPANGVVLDPFMGSGSTGCAAVAEGFRFIGIELNAGYLEIARARIAAAHSLRGVA